MCVCVCVCVCACVCVCVCKSMCVFLRAHQCKICSSTIKNAFGTSTI